LASFTAPAECAAGRVLIEHTATDHGRSIDPEHYGAMVMYSHDVVPDWLAAALRTIKADADVHELVCVGVDAIRRRIDEYLAAGVSKFVLVPLDEPDTWAAELDTVAPLLDLQT